MINSCPRPATLPDANPPIYIQHRSVPIYNERMKPIQYRAEDSTPEAAGYPGLTICSAWMTNPLDAVPPASALRPDPHPALAGAPLPLRSPFAGSGIPIVQNTQPAAHLSAEESPGERSASESPISDQREGSACLPVLGDPPPSSVEALGPDSEATADNAAETDARQADPAECSASDAAYECTAEEEEMPQAAIPASRSKGDAAPMVCKRSLQITSAAPLPKKWKHSTVSRRKIRGLLHYRKWWFFREVGISVEGKMLTGTPIFIREDTLRVVNGTYSYFIPMDNVDYIRTPDGYKEACAQFEENTLCEMC